MTSFSLNCLCQSPTSKYSHIGAMNLEGDTIQSLAGGHHKPGSWSHIPFRIPIPDGEGKEKQRMGSRNGVAGPVRGRPWGPWRDTELAKPRAVERSPWERRVL